MNTSTIANVATMQRCRCYANIPMNIFTIVNVTTTQPCGYYADIPKKPPHIMNALTTQLGTSCSFDSPGLARDEPTPGKHPHGDSTP